MIEDVCFLLHHTRPVEFGDEPKLVLVEARGSEAREVPLQALLQIGKPIVSHSFSLLVEWFRHKGLMLPKNVIDLEIAKKLLVGTPKSDYKSVFPWDMPSLIEEFWPPEYDLGRFRSAFRTHLAFPTSTHFDDIRAMRAVGEGLPRLWSRMVSDLEEKGELQRFLEIEVPVYNLLLAMQYQGVKIDSETRTEFLNSIEDEYISTHHDLAINHNIDVDRALLDVNYLSSLLKVPLDSASEPKRLIKSMRDQHPLCARLYSLDKAQRNRQILLRTSFTNDRCFPIYDSIGTVTGRIVAVDPRLQQLNRRYRSIIRAAAHSRLLYLDYAQFEPHIMASISQDSVLLKLCENPDLYQALAQELWGSANYRNTAKAMFLSYSYGMDERTLINQLLPVTSSQSGAQSLIREKFLPLFDGLKAWKAGVAADLLSYGRVGTAVGAYRYRTQVGELTSKERRWAVSQMIQGTGALILKKAMLTVSSRVPDASILLPMFDALLLQVPLDSKEDLGAILIECLTDAFREVCPSSIPSVRVKPFSVSPSISWSSRN